MKKSIIEDVKKLLKQNFTWQEIFSIMDHNYQTVGALVSCYHRSIYNEQKRCDNCGLLMRGPNLTEYTNKSSNKNAKPKYLCRECLNKDENEFDDSTNCRNLWLFVLKEAFFDLDKLVMLKKQNSVEFKNLKDFFFCSESLEDICNAIEWEVDGNFDNPFDEFNNCPFSLSSTGAKKTLDIEYVRRKAIEKGMVT
jgi:hypothetical protein